LPTALRAKTRHARRNRTTRTNPTKASPAASHPARRWVEAHHDRIELEFLPGYSPELKPTELLNDDLKTKSLGRRRHHSQQELIDEWAAGRAVCCGIASAHVNGNSPPDALN